PPRATLFPYTTLFRSSALGGRAAGAQLPHVRLARAPDAVDGDSWTRRSAPRGSRPQPVGVAERDRRGGLPSRAARRRRPELVRRSEEHTSELQSRENL